MRPAWVLGEGQERGRPQRKAESSDPPWTRRSLEESSSLKRSNREEEVPPRDSSFKKFRLSKTEGLAAVAAWAARKEILEMINAGATADDIRELIAQGEETGPSLEKLHPLS